MYVSKEQVEKYITDLEAIIDKYPVDFYLAEYKE